MMERQKRKVGGTRYEARSLREKMAQDGVSNLAPLDPESYALPLRHIGLVSPSMDMRDA